MTEKEVPRRLAVERRPVYISLPFKGDTLGEIAQRRLMSVNNKTFGSAKLRIFV